MLTPKCPEVSHTVVVSLSSIHMKLSFFCALLAHIVSESVSPGDPHTRITPVAPWCSPLNADRREESYPNEIPRHGREGPEEVLPQVGFLQREVLVGLHAGRHLRQRVSVTLMEGLFPKVLVLQRIGEVAEVKCG